MPRKTRRKKSSPAKYAKKVASRKRRNAALVGNPAEEGGMISQIAHTVVPGIAAYTVTRVGGRIAYGVTKKKWPRFSKHAGPLGTIVTAVGLGIAGSRMERLSQYQASIMVGAGIAAAQTVLQTYIPQYGWIMNDWHLQAAKNAKGIKEAPAPSEVIDFDQVTSSNSSSELPAPEDDLSDIIDDDYVGSLGGGFTH